MARTNHKAVEYQNAQQLNENEKPYVIIPESVILNAYTNTNRVSVFSFFCLHKGINNDLYFSVNELVRWLNRVPQRSKRGINAKVNEILNYMEEENYLTLPAEFLDATCIKASFNVDTLDQECKSNRYAVIYWDEIMKILAYKNSECTVGNDTLLLVFAYLRMMIAKRPNTLTVDELNQDNKKDLQYDIKIRKQNMPEVLDCFYYEIAFDLNLSEKTIYNSIVFLCEMGLIYAESLPRYKNNKGNWVTPQTLFCNTYKREREYLLASGVDYYTEEIANKKKKLRHLMRNRKEGDSIE